MEALTRGRPPGTSVQSVNLIRQRTCDADANCSVWEETYEPEPEVLVSRAFSFGPQLLQVQVVPEPATAALWLLGLGTVGSLLRRRCRPDSGRPVSPR